MKFEKTYTIGAREMGLNNELTNYGFLAFLEDIASNHSNTVGYGVKDIAIKKRAWILMDWVLEVEKRPSFGEKIFVKTWAIPMQLDKPTYHVYRNFEIYDEQNSIIAKATSKWVFLDTESNKITKIDSDLISLYSPEGSYDEARDKIEKLKEPDSFEHTFEYLVKRSDIDINKHMHNLNYINLAYEVLPEEIYNSRELNHVHIMYKHQIKLGEVVRCFYSYIDGKHIVTVKSKDGKTLHSIIELF